MVAGLNQTFTCDGNAHVPSTKDIVKTTIIIIIMLLIIMGNMFCLVVFNSRRSRRHFTTRVRYAMNSMCCTDLGIGLLMCPSTIYPALYQCWPFGEGFCKVEALLISALFHESTLNMVLVAVDRYFIIHHSAMYNKYVTSRRYMAVILATWAFVFSTYAIVIFAGEQFYFDKIGINCEPFYENADVTISVISIFYFIPVIIFVFCYGSIYRTATQRQVLTLSVRDSIKTSKTSRMKNANIRTSKYLAAITVGFFVAISPWTLCTLIIVAAKIQLNAELDYFVTWLALSNSFWNCLIYSVMNRKFRMAAAQFACGRWVKSLHDATKSSDESKDHSEDTPAYETYMRKQSCRRTCTVKTVNQQYEMTRSTSTSDVTPNHALGHTDADGKAILSSPDESKQITSNIEGNSNTSCSTNNHSLYIQ